MLMNPTHDPDFNTKFRHLFLFFLKDGHNIKILDKDNTHDKTQSDSSLS